MKMPYILKNKDFAKNAHSTCELSLVRDGEAQACMNSFSECFAFYLHDFLENQWKRCGQVFEIKNVFLRQNRKSWAKCYP